MSWKESSGEKGKTLAEQLAELEEIKARLDSALIANKYYQSRADSLEALLKEQLEIVDTLKKALRNVLGPDEVK